MNTKNYIFRNIRTCAGNGLNERVHSFRVFFYGFESEKGNSEVLKSYPNCPDRRRAMRVLRNVFAFAPQPSINTTNIDTLLVATDQTERIVEPPENIQEKIAFIFNNLSQSNMTQKVESSVISVLSSCLHDVMEDEFVCYVMLHMHVYRLKS